jgi:MFS transporter, DHA1 family, multidrug resistance protein
MAASLRTDALQAITALQNKQPDEINSTEITWRLLWALAGIVLAIDAWTNWGGLAGLALPLFLFVSATGFIVANSIAGALAAFPERAGAVSALVGTLQYGAGILGSALAGTFADGTPRPMGLVVALAGIGGLLCTRPLRAAPAISRNRRVGHVCG